MLLSNQFAVAVLYTHPRSKFLQLMSASHEGTQFSRRIPLWLESPFVYQLILFRFPKSLSYLGSRPAMVFRDDSCAFEKCIERELFLLHVA